MLSTEVSLILLAILVSYVIYYTFSKYVLPKLLEKSVKEIEKNPKWITSELQSKYYGFNDIDFILAESIFGNLPRFRVSKDRKRLEMLLPADTSTRDVETIGQLALEGKIQALHGLIFRDKPIYWLSILCYMLDGGEISIKDKIDTE